MSTRQARWPGERKLAWVRVQKRGLHKSSREEERVEEESVGRVREESLGDCGECGGECGVWRRGGECGQGVVWRRGSRACAPGRVDGQKHGRPHGRRSSQREEKGFSATLVLSTLRRSAYCCRITRLDGGLLRPHLSAWSPASWRLERHRSVPLEGRQVTIAPYRRAL